MKLLLVDDEYYSVEGLKVALNWEAMGFSQVLCAYNMEQAMAIFAEHTIDVLVIDIEMPKGNGLEVVARLREEGHQTACIFLTSFAKFEYCQSALALQSVDYLLKPAEKSVLQASVSKAIEQVQRQRAMLENKRLAEYWSSSKTVIAEQFWYDLALGIIPPLAAAIDKEMGDRHIAPPSSKEMLLVLVDCTNPAPEQWEKNLYEYAIRNILMELVLNQDETAVIARLTSQCYLLPCMLTDICTQPVIFERCHAAIAALGRALPGTFGLYVSERSVGLPEVAVACGSLLHAAQNNVSCPGGVFDLAKAPPKAPRELHMPLETWKGMLSARQTEVVGQEVQAYLDALMDSSGADRNDLMNIYQGFLMMLYSLLGNIGENAHQSLQEVRSIEAAEQACRSIVGMKRWICQTLDAFDRCVEAAKQAGSAVAEVKRYVHAHLAENLSRNSLAKHVFLNPDYLSHIFREQTGASLTQFISQERMQKAKELLLQGQLSIGDIALTSGFQSISYFSKQFKRATGRTPQDYRR